MDWPLVQILAIVALTEVRIFSPDEDKGFIALVFSDEKVGPNRKPSGARLRFTSFRERESG